jgi:hypothetical protein
MKKFNSGMFVRSVESYSNLIPGTNLDYYKMASIVLSCIQRTKEVNQNNNFYDEPKNIPFDDGYVFKSLALSAKMEDSKRILLEYIKLTSLPPMRKSNRDPDYYKYVCKRPGCSGCFVISQYPKQKLWKKDPTTPYMCFLVKAVYHTCLSMFPIPNSSIKRKKRKFAHSQPCPHKT